MENPSQTFLNSSHNNNENIETDNMGFQIYNDFIVVDSKNLNFKTQNKLTSSFADYTKNAMTSLTKSVLNFKEYLMPSPVSINTLKNPMIFTVDNRSSEKITFELDSLILFTYRNHFYKITNDLNNSSYISDKGWGCAIRCGQMILAKALMNFNLSAHNIDIAKKIRKNIIELFCLA